MNPPPRNPVPAAAPRREPAAKAVSVQQIFLEHTFRRAALIQAITADVEEFFRKCDPNLNEMCLYGHTDGSWEVCEPEPKVPPNQPEPVIGISIARDTLERVQWLENIAIHCDSWLIRVSFFIGARLLNAAGREHLFTSINSLPTVHEVFLESDTYQRLCEAKSREAVEDGVEDEDNSEENEIADVQDNDDYFCGTCGFRYHANAFWISCDVCEGWFHGRCVNITQEQATSLDHFICPECGYDNNGHDYD